MNEGILMQKRLLTIVKDDNDFTVKTNNKSPVYLLKKNMQRKNTT